MTNFMGDVASTMVRLEASSRRLIKYRCTRVQDWYLDSESVDVHPTPLIGENRSSS
jgi:hypothetical protein